MPQARTFAVAALAAALIAGALASSPATAAQPIDAVASSHAVAAAKWAPKITRVGGSDRYETSARLSRLLPLPAIGVETLFIASGEAYPDALSAASGILSEADRMLLVKRTSIPAVIRSEIIRLQPRTIVVVGGTGVVSSGVVTALRALPLHDLEKVVRVGGADRFETSVKLADYLRFPSTQKHTSTLVTGRDFPDALSASATAAVNGARLYLVPRTCVPRYVLEDLERRAPATIRIVGGSGAVSSAVNSLTPCAQPEWLTRLNQERASFGAPPVTEDPAAAGELAAHIAYSVSNGRVPDWVWREDAANAFSTEIGREAEESAFLLPGSAPDLGAALRSPFTLAQLLDTSPSTTGAATAAFGGLWTVSTGRIDVGPQAPAPIGDFASWPADGAVVQPGLEALTAARPNPYEVCGGVYQQHHSSGYEPLGAPILFRVPGATDRPLTARLLADGDPVATCLVAPDGVRSVESELDAAMNVLAASSSALVLPLDPLRASTTYTLEVQSQDAVYRSTFTTAP